MPLYIRSCITSKLILEEFTWRSKVWFCQPLAEQLFRLMSLEDPLRVYLKDQTGHKLAPYTRPR